MNRTRSRPPPRRAFPLGGFLFGLLAAPTAVAQPYLGGGVGFHRANALEVAGRSNDGPSFCDEYFNPHYARLEACRAPDGGAWLLAYGSAGGADGSAVVGYRLGRLRIEAEYLFASSGYDRFAPATGVSREVLGKFDGELVRAEERLGDVDTRAAFANLLFDLPVSDRLTAFVGVGAGGGRLEADYGSVWARNPDPQQIRSGAELDIPNYADFQRALASTTTTYHGELADFVFGWQALAGLDLSITDSATMGLRVRRAAFARFEVEERNGWDQLRSHPSENRLDGSAPAWFWIETDDLGLLGASLTLRVSF